MQLEKSFIEATAVSELTDNEIRSFKYGNKPNEETFLKAAIIKAYECMTIRHSMDGEKKVMEETVKWVNDASDAVELERKNYRFFGHPA